VLSISALRQRKYFEFTVSGETESGHPGEEPDKG